MNRKIFSFDAETDGLWGNPFAIAAIVYTHHPEMDRGIDGKLPAHWEESERFIARLPSHFVTNDWVKENVLPTIEDIAPTHNTYNAMVADFAKFYMAHHPGAECIAHMGYIVEAHLLREMRSLELIGDFDAPFPLYDVSGNLQAAGEDPTSVDGYAKKNGLKISGYGATHNPLYDCEVAAKCYIHLTT